MSPHLVGEGMRFPRFPRVSGDEPALCTELIIPLMFSPRERG